MVHELCALQSNWAKNYGLSTPDELPYLARGTLIQAVELADACSKRICSEVVQDSVTRNYIPDPWALGYLHHPHADPNRITILRQMGINTTDARNYSSLPPSRAAFDIGLCGL